MSNNITITNSTKEFNLDTTNTIGLNFTLKHSHNNLLNNSNYNDHIEIDIDNQQGENLSWFKQTIINIISSNFFIDSVNIFKSVLVYMYDIGVDIVYTTWLEEHQTDNQKAKKFINETANKVHQLGHKHIGGFVDAVIKEIDQFADPKHQYYCPLEFTQEAQECNLTGNNSINES